MPTTPAILLPNELASSFALVFGFATILCTTLAVDSVLAMLDKLAGGTWSDTALAMAVARVAGGIPRAEASSEILASTDKPLFPFEPLDGEPEPAAAWTGFFPIARFNHPPASLFQTVNLQV